MLKPKLSYGVADTKGTSTKSKSTEGQSTNEIQLH